MNKLIIGCIAVFCLFSVGGCQTTKNTATGVVNITKGLVEDVAVSAGALMKADQWFKENYW